MNLLSAKQPRPWLVLGWACLGVLLAAADLTALTSLIPQITLDLRVPLPSGLTDVAWVVNAYLIGNIVALPISGRLTDRLGRQVVFLGCLGVFVAGSIGSALAPTLWTLVAARAVQAIGAGAMVPVTMTLATDLLPRHRWPLAFGLIGAVDTIGWAIGPLYGALFVNQLNWRALFWANVPLGGLVVWGCWRALRGLTTTQNRRTIDWLGAGLLTVGLTALNIGLSKLGGGAAAGISFDAQSNAVPWQDALPWLVGGLGGLGLFGVLQWRLIRAGNMPLINIRPFATPPVAAAALLNLVFGVLLITAVVDVPLFINAVGPGDGSAEAVRAAAVRSGLVLMALTTPMALGAPLGGILAQRLGGRSTVFLGAVCTVVGFWLMRTWEVTTPLPVILMQLALVGSGFGLMLAPPAAVLVAAAPPDERGLMSSLVLLLRLGGMSLGLSALTAWSIDRFRTLSTADSLGALTGDRVQVIIVDVLTSTFAVAAAIALIAVVLAAIQTSRAERSVEVGRGKTAP